MEKKAYYKAYDDRYSQVHAQNLRWFSETPSAIVSSVIRKFGIGMEDPILEIGCGEGRDALALLQQGYDLLATDVSDTVIRFCQKEHPQFAQRFQVLDCLKDNVRERFDFIYAIAVVHMLVEDEDRKRFYAFIREHLKADGISLIATMGDGEMERKSDISTAFNLQERIHEQSGKTVHIAGTSYRAVSFDTFRRELHEAGLQILEEGITQIQPDYYKVMYAVVKVADEIF